MQNQPQRRPQRIAHLDASVVHVENALLARAKELETQAAQEGGTAKYLFMASEFRLLAEELHWW